MPSRQQNNGFGNSSSTSKKEENPLKYPIASSRTATVWINYDEKNEKYCLSIKLEIPFLGSENFRIYGTDTGQGAIDQLGDYWKELNSGGDR